MRNIKRQDNYKRLFSKSPMFLIKDCKECGQCDKKHRRAEVSSGGTVQYRSVCVDCWKKKEQAYRLAHREEINKKKVERARKAKARCVEYKGGACECCGYNKSLRALTFHHRDRQSKEYEITIIKDHNWDKVKTELDKCILVCFNCHMEQEEKYESNKLC